MTTAPRRAVHLVATATGVAIVERRSPHDGLTLFERLGLLAILSIGPVFWLAVAAWWFA